MTTVWTYCPECGSAELHHEEGRHKQCANCHQEWFSDSDYSNVVQENLSTLFLRQKLMYQQVGALLAGRERMGDRIRKLRAYIASNCPHAAADINCPTCEFLKEDAQ